MHRGRCGKVDDDHGLRLIVGRIVVDLEPGEPFLAVGPGIAQINRAFGSTRLADVRPSQGKAWKANLKADGYADSTVYATYRRFAQIMADAVHDGVKATDFDLDDIAAIALAGEIPVLAALDSAESLDARERGVAMKPSIRPWLSSVAETRTGAGGSSSKSFSRPDVCR